MTLLQYFLLVLAAGAVVLGLAFLWGSLILGGNADRAAERPFSGEVDEEDLPPRLPPELEMWRRPGTPRRRS